MRIQLAYGKTGLEVEIPDAPLAGVLAYKDAPPLPDPDAALAEVVQHPNGSPPLAAPGLGSSK